MSRLLSFILYVALIYTVLLVCLIPKSKAAGYSRYDSPAKSPVNRGKMRNEYDENAYDERNDLPYDEYNPNGNEEEGIDHDLVASYMKSFPSKMMVASSAAVGSYFASGFLSNMIIGNAFFQVNAALAAAGLVLTFTKGFLASFLQAYGVLLILLVKRFNFKTFLLQLTRQVKSMLMVSERKYFPPNTDNPWKASPDSQIQFSMINTMSGAGLLGAIVGWKILGLVPLLRLGWIGAIIGAAFTAYATTFRNGQGDMLRFVGWSVTGAYGELRVAMNDVQFWDKISVVFNLLVQLFKRLDGQYNIVSKLQFAFAQAIAMITMSVSKMKTESNDTSGGVGGRRYSAPEGTRAQAARRESANGKRQGPGNVYEDDFDDYGVMSDDEGQAPRGGYGQSKYGSKGR